MLAVALHRVPSPEFAVPAYFCLSGVLRYALLNLFSPWAYPVHLGLPEDNVVLYLVRV